MEIQVDTFQSCIQAKVIQYQRQCSFHALLYASYRAVSTRRLSFNFRSGLVALYGPLRLNAQFNASCVFFFYFWDGHKFL